MLRNPNVRMVLIALALIVLVGAVGIHGISVQIPSEQTTKPTATPQTAEETVTPETVEPTATAQTAEATAESAREQPKGYLLVQVGEKRWPPMPLAEDGEYVVEQEDGCKNVIHTTATSAVMHFSTCENQSCVMQGVASLENRDTRILGGMIVCLPNQVLLEVVTPEDLGMQEEEP